MTYQTVMNVQKVAMYGISQTKRGDVALMNGTHRLQIQGVQLADFPLGKKMVVEIREALPEELIAWDVERGVRNDQ